MIELGEEMLLKNLEKLDNDLIQLDESDNEIDAADIAANDSGIENDLPEATIEEIEEWAISIDDKKSKVCYWPFQIIQHLLQYKLI